MPQIKYIKCMCSSIYIWIADGKKPVACVIPCPKNKKENKDNQMFDDDTDDDFETSGSECKHLCNDLYWLLGHLW